MPFFASTNAADEFAKVKSGMSSSPSTIAYEYFILFFAGLALLIGLLAVINWIRKKKHAPAFKGWASITEPNNIAVVLKRAAERQANCTLEIFDHRHTNIYRGQVYESTANLHIILELSRLPGPDTDFASFPAQIHLNFRPNLQEEMEHYQFSSHTIDITYEKEKNWRVPRVTVDWPKSVISAQRRDFLRLEPGGEYAIIAILKAAAEAQVLVTNPDNLPQLAEGSVLDISVGGIQLLFPGGQKIPEAPKFLITLDLPVTGLDLELAEPKLHLIITPLTKDLISDDSQSAAGLSRTILRAEFSGRYRFDQNTNIWSQVAFNQDSFQDLAHWIHAYQRHQLQKEKGLTPSKPDRVNAYQAVPPERPTPKP